MAFKDLFVKGDEPVPQQNPQASVNPQPVQAVPVQPVGGTQQTTISADAGIVDTIWKKIIEKNRPGPDYLELKNNVEALEDLPISPEQKILSAFKVLQKNYPNFKKEDITTAIDFYKKVVDEEKQTGLSELDSLVSEKVDAVSDEIRQMQEQAAELKKKYDGLQERIAARNIDMTTAKADLDMKRSVFMGSVEAVMNVLDSDRDKIDHINF
jgi:hypothetical protein